MKEFEGLIIENCESENTRNICVMKFGGTSVGCAEGVESITEIIACEQRNGSRVAVVVSAMNGTTSQLRNIIDSNERTKNSTSFGSLVQEHITLIEGLGFDEEAQRELFREVFKHFLSLENEVFNNEHFGLERSDKILAHGEIISATIISKYLQKKGIRCEFVNASEIIKTNDTFGDAEPIMDESGKNIRNRLTPLINEGIVPVITGFIGSTSDGRITTLGEGGSDCTATLIAPYINAGNVYLYKKDVDGIYNKDPKILPDAKIIEEMSQFDADRMSKNGNTVLAEGSVEPLFGTEIDLYIKDTMHPERPGTLITSRLNFQLEVK